MGRVILECGDFIVEANEEVVNGNNFHYARWNDSPGNQGSNTAKSVHPILHHCVSGTSLALHKRMRLALVQGGPEKLSVEFLKESKNAAVFM